MTMKNNQASSQRIITLDGPSGAGKGTLGVRLASHFGWHYLDSGALYRIIAWRAARHQVSVEDARALAELIKETQVSYRIDPAQLSYTTWVNGVEVSSAIRTEQCGQDASAVAKHVTVREALRSVQQGFAQAPGLVADGRDMGTAIFPQAAFKFFVDAACEQRAQRRHAQLLAAGHMVAYTEVLADLQARDQRDRNRAVAPLVPAQDATLIDTTEMTVDEAFAAIRQHIERLS
jgi:cytidylate kinase